jgi:PTS system nitrogen regulatory IIA component
MDVDDFLRPADVLADVQAPDKARLLKDLSVQAAAQLRFNPDVIQSEILKREALGSTGIGDGVAIPHARIPNLDRPFGIFARLSTPIAFEAVDEQPVDVVFFLLLPPAREAEQLNTLACVARRVRDTDALRRMRAALDSAALYRAILAGPPRVR